MACNSENNLLPPDVVVGAGGLQQPPRRASLEIANFIFRHEIQLIRKTSPIIGQIAIIITSGLVLSFRKMQEGWCEGHMDEGARPHLNVKPTFHIHLHSTFTSHSSSSGIVVRTSVDLETT